MNPSSFSFPDPLPLDRTPWLYFSSEDEALRSRQEAWQAHLKNLESLAATFEDPVFISEQATVGNGTLSLGERSYIGAEAQVGGEITIGKRCTVNAGAVVRGSVKMGNGVRIATGAQILGFNHETKHLDRYIHEQPIISEGIVMGDDIWVGANAIILDGVTIGSHSILAAGAIVTKDVPEWAVVGGNPARLIKDRRGGSTVKHADANASWNAFQARVEDELPELLAHYLDPETGTPRNVPGEEERMRPWCDLVEIASTVEVEIPGWSKEDLIAKLQSFQDPETGLVPGPYGEAAEWKGKQDPVANRMTDGHSAYGVMSVGYALECLGSHLPYPVSVASELRHADLYDQLGQCAWTSRAWGAGAWVDHYASAMAMNAVYHDGDRDLSDLFGWLNLHADPVTGMWGRPTPNQGMLQPVNGFYRLTRGSYAQWGIPLPEPERAIDTVLAHALDQRHVGPGKPTACIVLDIIHPLWLCLKQTSYRRGDCEQQARHWLERAVQAWVPEKGFSFHMAEGLPPGLQGTEMWLSIVWLCADLLGLDTQSGYRPKGVHRPEVMVNGIFPV